MMKTRTELQNEVRILRGKNPQSFCGLCEETKISVTILVDGDEFGVCSDCCLDLNISEGDRDWLSSFEVLADGISRTAKKMSKRFVTEDEAFADNPKLRRTMKAFVEGRYTLDDGTEDEMLTSIHERFDKGSVLSEKQEKAFIGRCSFYAGRRIEGEPLVDSVKLRKNGKEVESKLADAKHLGSSCLDKKGKEMIESFTKFYESRGYLTDKQFAALVKIVAQGMQYV